MKHSILLLSLVTGILFVASAVAPAQEAASASTAVEYSVKVNEFEGCECQSVCPCVFAQDTTYGECRTLLAFTFNGTYGHTELSNASAVLVGTSLGENVSENCGNWKGFLYTSDSATPAETEAVKALMDMMIGPAFASLEHRKAPIEIQRKDDVRELKLGKIAHLRIKPIKRANGETTKIVNAPSPVAFKEMYCAIADVHTYDDGEISWSFPGRNGFFTSFELKSE